MSASFAFVSWVRRGIATAIETRDDPGASIARVTIPVNVQFNASLDADVRLGLHGPGEVIGFDERAVSRRWPVPGTTEAEPNLFALVEFDQVDLPWRYTPARANVKDRLRPWLCLIVLADDEIDLYELPKGDRRLPAVTVRAGAPLPRLDQAWAWAHVQLSGAETADANTLNDALAQRPHAVLARLLCPRQLKPNQAYTAMLVPTFEHGRRAGLREPLTGTDNALAPAWSGSAGPVRLPVYHRWRFVTGPAGDFESLVKRLEPRRLPSTVGIRDLDVSLPGAGLPAAAKDALGLEGALRAPTTKSTEWSDPERGRFVDALEGLLDLPAEARDAGERPIVAPPLYGGWHALEERLRDEPTAPWFLELSSDPRHRVAAGLGTQVVQAQERLLMASAWEQVGSLREINARLRHAQLAREVSVRLHERLFDDATPLHGLVMSRPLHARVLGSPTTIRAVLDASPVPTGLLDGTFRRVSRAVGPIGKRQERLDRPTSTLVERANRGTLTAAPPALTHDALPTHDSLTPRAPGADDATVADWRRWAAMLRLLAMLLPPLAVFFLIQGAFLVVAVLLAVTLVAAMTAASLARRADTLERQLATATGTVSPELIAAAPQRPDFVATDPALPVPAQELPGNGEDSASARAFRQAAQALALELIEPPAPGAVLKPANLTLMQAKLKTALDPRVTIPRGIKDYMTFPAGVLWPHPDPLEPVIPGPEFPQPMYKPLAELSPEWVLPGLERIPPDTVALALTNPPFIEAYMVGLNHEMSRELVWNEYPTSQRKTYFRQFWDPAGHVNRAPGTPSLEDIRPIHEWGDDAKLGENSPRPPPPDGKHLVVLIRGELFRRYPRTIVSAVRAKLDGQRRTTSDEELSPVFRGVLPSDLVFFGFDLSEDEARGTDGGLGWYIILQEHPSEPRFGLDVAPAPSEALTSWSDLSWGHLVGTGGDPATIEYIDLDAEHPATTAPGLSDARWHAEAGIGPKGSRAADLAYITLQQPMRIAMHAADMLPPKEETS